MPVKVAPTVAGEVAVWAGVRTVTSVGQHVAFEISFSDERTSANPALKPHLQNRKHTSVSVPKRRTLAATDSNSHTGHNTGPGAIPTREDKDVQPTSRYILYQFHHQLDWHH